jgi:hypothetical protein
LLIRESRLLVPLAVLVIQRPAFLYTIVTLINAAALSIPLASLSGLLSLLSSSLLISYATLIINLSPLPL